MARDRGVCDLLRNVDNLGVVRVEESAGQFFGAY
jgi:hypothetical protein